MRLRPSGVRELPPAPAGTCFPCPRPAAGEARAGGSVRTPGSAPAVPRAPDRPLAAYRGHRGARPPWRAVPPLSRRPPPPPRQDSAGSAEQPFSAAAAAPEPSRAARASSGTSRGVPAPRCRFRNGRPELRRVLPEPGGLRRGAGRDNPTLSPPFCYRAGVFPKQTQRGSLGNGTPLCRGGRCPQPGPGSHLPAAPHPCGHVPGRPAAPSSFPPGSPLPSALCAHSGRGSRLSEPRETRSRPAGTGSWAAVPRRGTRSGAIPPLPVPRDLRATRFSPPTPRAAK